MILSKETARTYCEILLNALYQFSSVGGDLHIITDDGNVSDEDIEFCYNYTQNSDTPQAQKTVEIAILDLLKPFNERDRYFILLEYNICMTIKKEEPKTLIKKKEKLILESIWIQWDNHTNEEALELVTGLIDGLQELKTIINNAINEDNDT